MGHVANVFLALASFHPALPGESLEYGFRGPHLLAGLDGSPKLVRLDCLLTHSGTGLGASGWSFGLAARGGRIVGITVSDEIARLAQVNEAVLTKGDGNEGAICTIVLSGDGHLSPNSTTVVATIEVATSPYRPLDLLTLEYRDGMVGANGLGVFNRVVEASSGVAFLPEL